MLDRYISYSLDRMAALFGPFTQGFKYLELKVGTTGNESQHQLSSFRQASPEIIDQRTVGIGELYWTK